LAAKEIITVLSKILTSKSFKKAKGVGGWSFFTSCVIMCVTYGPSVISKYERIDNALKSYDSLQIYYSKVYNWTKQHDIQHEFERNNQAVIIESVRDELKELDRRELSKDASARAEQDPINGLTRWARKDNHEDIWYYEDGWMYAVSYSRSDKVYYYEKDNKRIEIQ